MTAPAFFVVGVELAASGFGDVAAASAEGDRAGLDLVDRT
jgi:hypothetical protein